MRALGTAAPLACWLAISASAGAGAQTLPSQPIALADGRVTLGGDVSASFGSADPGFFNYTDYDHSALRTVRIDVAGAVTAGPHFAVLGELQTENIDSIRPYALYLRIRPWTSRSLDIQVGRVPPTFGAFARRTYASDNPLIGYPLGYQYLTTLRPDSLPASTDEMLQKRGLGWLLKYSVGDAPFDHGVPLVSAFRWDTGVQVHAETASGVVRGTVAVTAGTLSNPLVIPDNSGRQVAGRLELRPVAGFVLGTSAARGPFVSTNAANSASSGARDGDFTQTAFGVDAEYSHGYYLVRIETIVSEWRLPLLGPPNGDLSLGAVSTSVEGRYKFAPGLYAAARFDHLGFSEITGTLATLPWDVPVSRVEVGAGYSIQRNLLLKLSFQHDSRPGGRLAQTANQTAVQLVFWL
jgi:hypothetical protein